MRASDFRTCTIRKFSDSLVNTLYKAPERNVSCIFSLIRLNTSMKCWMLRIIHIYFVLKDLQKLTFGFHPQFE